MTDVISSTVAATTNLAFYTRHGAALFPIPHGRKAPHGIVGSFKHHFSHDPAQWTKWREENPGCNFGIVAFASNLIILDTDIKPREGQTAEDAREEAWKIRWELFATWGLDPAKHPAHVSTPHHGWHDYFAVPPGIDTATLRQPDAIRGRINVRVIGYTVAAGSHYDGTEKGDEPGHYTLATDAPPHPAPQALIEHCSPAASRDSVAVSSGYDQGDTAKMLEYLTERGEFDSYEAWLTAGMSLKTEFGDAGLDLWALTHNDTVTPEAIESKWESFASEPKAGGVSIRSLMKRAHALGWVGRLQPAGMFAGAAKLVAAAGLPGMPVVASPPVAPGTPGAQAGANSTDSTALRSRRVSAATLEGKPVPERGWSVHDLIPARNVTLLYGDGGTGKSLLELQMAACMTIGRPFFGHLVKQGRVEFITAEDSLDEMHRRLVDVARWLGTTLGALSGLHLTSLAEVDALLAVAEDTRGGALVMTALFRELETVIAESRPELVVLDTLADIFGGNEVVRAQARQFIGMLRKLCLAYDCAIVVLAHPSLSGMDKGTSGSTGWNNSVRSRLLFRRVYEKDGTEADEDARVLEVGKSNYGRVGLQIPMQWRYGVFEHTAGRGADPMTIAAKADSVFLELLRKAIEQNNHVSLSKKGRHYAPEIFRPDAAKKSVTAKELEHAMRRLLDSKRIENAPFGAPSRREFRLYVGPAS